MVMVTKAGGGINSNKLVRPSVRIGTPSAGKNPKAVGQIGSTLGNKATNQPKLLTKAVESIGAKAPAAASVPLGNEVATNVGKGGPGAGRTVYGSGSQCQHGPVAGARK
jgi:hypothetical protein